MIEAIHNQRFDAIGLTPGQMAAGSANFAALFGDATKAGTPAASQSAVSTAPAGLGAPDVQAWLTSYYQERTASSDPQDAESADIPYEPATGAGSNYSANSVIGPDQIYTQALYNQNGYLFANMTGSNPANFTSQLPGIPTVQAQQEFDGELALENAQRLASGQPIDTSAYWSDPGPVTVNGQTFTSQELGYAGPGQSSGAEPIYISLGDQVAGTNNFVVPGYSGTVTGVQAGRYYTLQQLEQAGLKAGQPDTQFHPGSWALTTST
jgi:hypothetical protein